MDSSYRHYRQYQANRYQYKVNQITAPIVVMIVISIVTKYWWIIVAGIALVFAMKLGKRHSKKQDMKEKTMNSMVDNIVKQKQEKHFQKGEIGMMSTTETGYTNRNNQRNNGRTDKPGTDFGQWFYEMECLECGHKHLVNGSNIYEKRCPNCQKDRKSKANVAGQKSTETGYINKNNQKNNGKTDIPGTGNGQWFYDMECLNCGHKYYANGHDVWLRKCPKCQGGRT